MKIKNQILNTVLASVFELLVGILLLVNPVGFTSGILTAAGVVAALVGIKSVALYFLQKAEVAAVSHGLQTGIGCLLLGWFLIFKNGWIIAIFPVLTVVYGVVILIAGLAKLQTAVDMIRLKRSRWFLALISAALSLACAGVILMNPFTTTGALWMFIGITLIVEAVLDIVTAIFCKNRKTAEEPEEAEA